MKGKIFVIESGADSSGKATQAVRLYERLREQGYKVKKVEYPNYDSDSSALIKMYLRGEFGDSAQDVNCYAASVFYSVDRYASYRKEWKDFYEDGGIIIADRYTTSNMVHQASKIESEKDRIKYIEWLEELEFEKMELPRPDAVIFLDMPVQKSIGLMRERKNKFTGESEKDIHEKDSKYLIKTYENALWVSNLQGWLNIDCMDGEQIRSIDSIHEQIYGAIKGILDR